MILDSGFYISANETQFNPSGNSTEFPDFLEDVSSVPTEERAVEAASPGQPPLPDADVTDVSSEELVPVSVDAMPSPEQGEEAPLQPASVPTLPPAKRRSKAKKKQVSRPVSRKRRRTPSPQPSPAKSPIPVLRLFRNSENDSFMALAKLVRKSRRIREQGMR